MKAPRHIREARKAVAKEAIAKNSLIMAELKAERHVVVGRTHRGTFTTGYRCSPSPTVSHKFSEHPANGGGRKPELTLRDVLGNAQKWLKSPVKGSDKMLTSKQRKAKYRLHDSEFYDTKLAPKSVDDRCLRKVGMTPAHYVPIRDKDTGEDKLILVQAKPKWKEVGTQ